MGIRRGVIAFVCVLPCALAQAQPAPGGFDSSLLVARLLLETPERDIDLAKAKTTVDHLVDPSVDVAATLKQLDSMVELIRARLPQKATSQERLAALRTFLYESGPWNGQRPFHYDLDDPFGHNISNKLLSTYLSTRKGNCVSMPFLFLILGQRLGIDLSAAVAPEHVFVKYRNEAGVLVNLEATSGGGVSSDAWMMKNMPMTPQALANGVYLRPLTKTETVAVMLETLTEHLGQTGHQEARIALSELVLRYFPNDVMAMLQIHGAYGRMIEKRFRGRYATPRDIPPQERARFLQLDEASMAWRRRAEDLGWRQPDEATEQQYRTSVDQAKSAQVGGR